MGASCVLFVCKLAFRKGIRSMERSKTDLGRSLTRFQNLYQCGQDQSKLGEAIERFAAATAAAVPRLCSSGSLCLHEFMVPVDM